MPVYFQPTNISNEQQIMVTPIEKFCHDGGDKPALGIRSVGVDADVSAFDKKISVCDLPFHPLSLHNSLNESTGERRMIALQKVQEHPNLVPLKMRSSQSTFIANTMNDLREMECAAAAKRRKIEHWSTERHGTMMHSRSSEQFNDGDICNAVCADTDDDSSIDSSSSISRSSHRFDIQGALKAHPHAIQIVATSGGLITHWNEGFSKITKPSSSLRKTPLTIFDLVDPKSLPSLYSMLALSLHNIDVGKVETFCDRDKQLRPSASHLSITVPCKSFRKSPTSYNITVVFMDDIVTEERCFLGILVPSAVAQDSNEEVLSQVWDEREERNSATMNERSSPCLIPCGQVVRVDDNLLCHILLGTRVTS